MKKRGNEVVAMQAPVAKQVIQPVAPVEVETTVQQRKWKHQNKKRRKLLKMKTYIKLHHQW